MLTAKYLCYTEPLGSRYTCVTFGLNKNTKDYCGIISGWLESC